MNTRDEIILDIDPETKEALLEMASMRGVTVSEFIFGLISDGARLERQRRKRAKRMF